MAKVTRRRLGSMLAASSVAAQVSSAQAPAPTRAAEDQDLESARQRARDNAQAISQVKLAMTVEPAFKFRA